MKKIVMALCAATALGACTTTERVSIQQPGDRMMTCSALRSEFVKLDGILQEGRSNQGVNTANVAAVLFFWPAAVGNYVSARDAMQVAEQRRTHLMAIYAEKNCDNPANADLRFPVPDFLLAPSDRGMH